MGVRRIARLGFGCAAALAAAPAWAGPVLVCPTPNDDGVGYGGYACVTLTADLNLAAGGSPTATQPTAATVADLGTLLAYDGVWVDVRQPYGVGTLSAAESSALTSYAATGRRLVLIGGNDNFNSWDASILSVVGGTYAGSTAASTLTRASAVALTAGFSAIHSGSAGLAVPVGTPLFSPCAAVVAGPARNVLVLLDATAIIDDTTDNYPANAAFVRNVAAWAAGTLADPACGWQGADGSPWTTAANWAGGAMPGVGADATFDLAGTGRAIGVPASVVAGNVRVNTGSVRLDLTGGGLAAGSVVVANAAGEAGTLTLSRSTAGGSVVSAAAVAVGGNGGIGTFFVTAGVRLNVAGTVAIDPSSQLNASGGSVVAAGTLSGPAAVTAGGQLTVGGVASAALSVDGGGTVVVGPGPIGTLTALTVAGSLAAPAGRVDVTRGGFVVRGGNLASLTALARAGYANGSFAGPGLTSSVAAADAKHLTAVAVVSVAADAAGHATPAAYGGQTTAVGDVLVGYADYGDVDLNGVIDGRDYVRLDAGYAQHLTGWANGDFNYDGVVDGSDYTLIDNAFNRAAVTSAGPTADLAAVPEPSVVGLGVAAPALMRRRRSCHRPPTVR